MIAVRIWPVPAGTSGGKLADAEIVFDGPDQVAIREQFEQWIAAPPYERDLARWPPNDPDHAWPGQYRDIAVELAWHAFREAAGCPLAGLKLVGFAVWESHVGAATRAVTFPQRQHVQGGIRTTFGLLRPVSADRTGYDPAVVRLAFLVSGKID